MGGKVGFRRVVSVGLILQVGLYLLPGFSVRAGTRIPAFPGAEGYGTETPGGRGGAVIIVGNLNDAGPGSFRAACEAKGPRIVVFRVAGIIDLQSPVRISEPYITIAGQSTPGDGICLRRNPLVINTHDVVVRYIRSRLGDISARESDAMTVGGSSHHVVIDHCSVSWSTDEDLSPTGGISDVTVQWCLIAEGLNFSVHSKGPHGYGSLVRASGGLTLHHNLWAHNENRSPRLGDNYGRPPYPTFDVRNNVMYDYDGISIIGDVLRANYIANYLKPGPSSRPGRGTLSPTDKADTQFFVSGNIVAGRPEVSANQPGLFQRVRSGDRTLVTFLTEAIPTPLVHTTSAEVALREVLEQVGASLPVRDAVDRRIVRDVLEGTGSIIDSQWEVGGWPEYKGARPPVDSDRDGMPDSWEIAHGLNPNDSSDAAGDRDGDGYTNLEEYLNTLGTGRVKPAPRKQ